MYATPHQASAIRPTNAKVNLRGCSIDVDIDARCFDLSSPSGFAFLEPHVCCWVDGYVDCIPHARVGQREIPAA